VTDEIFRTARLRAVRWRDDHAPTAYSAYRHEDFVRYLGNSTPHPDPDYTARWVARMNEVQGDSPAGFWAVERHDGELVGATLCQPLPGDDGRHEIGWHVFPAHQRQGYATEIGRGAAAYGFDVFGLHEVFAVVMPANVASLAVARAVGMQPVGRTNRYYGVEAELFAMKR
jgi:RimJ/RimL family protein N-acetyltransferase